jgi:hypothetical protein
MDDQEPALTWRDPNPIPTSPFGLFGLKRGDSDLMKRFDMLGCDDHELAVHGISQSDVVFVGFLEDTKIRLYT